MQPIAVIGAGWAGLACALELSAAGLPVALFEAAKTAGGRARTVDRHGWRTDNGQHLLTGACSGVLAQLAALGVAEAAVLRRLPLQLRLLDATGAPRLQLTAAQLPPPLHLAAGLLRCRGLSWRERGALGLALHRLMRGDAPPNATVADWLQARRQAAQLRRSFWHPLCRAALNTPAEQACLRHFAAVLSESFFGPRSHSDLLIPRVGLSAVLPDPALRRLRANGAALHLGTAVRAIDGDAVIDRSGARLATAAVVIATPPRAAAGLLASCRSGAALATAQRLQSLREAAIATAYLRYSRPATLPARLLGLLDGPGEWLFDHGEGELAVVSSAVAPDLDREHWRQAVTAQLAGLPGVQGEPLASRTLLDRRATFLCSPKSTTLRPAPGHLCANLHLAGDYTATGLPATLEGAVRSGVECAASVIRSHTGTPF